MSPLSRQGCSGSGSFDPLILPAASCRGSSGQHVCAHRALTHLNEGKKEGKMLVKDSLIRNFSVSSATLRRKGLYSADNDSRRMA